MMQFLRNIFESEHYVLVDKRVAVVFAFEVYGTVGVKAEKAINNELVMSIRCSRSDWNKIWKRWGSYLTILERR